MKMRGILALVVLTTGLLAGCAPGVRMSDGLSGRSLVYPDGEPAFDLEALSDPSANGLLVHVGIPANSIVFLGRPEGLPAESGGKEGIVRVRLDVDNKEGQAVESVERTDTLRTEGGESAPYHILRFEIPVEAGAYLVKATVVDLATRGSADRSQWIQVDMSGVGTPHLISGERPLVPLFVNEEDEPLELRIPVRSGAKANVSAWLIAYPTDRSPAARPAALGGSLGSREYRGVLYERPDTLSMDAWILHQSYLWRMPNLAPGVYSIHVAEDDGEPFRRDLLVRDAGFPDMSSLPVLIEALSYIATPAEMMRLQGTGGPEDLRQRFDAFWGRLLGRSNVAQDVLTRYYSRAVYANRQYSGFKEGWRTDRGMVYMVMGPPVTIEPEGDSESWYYSYDQQDATRRFVFDRVGGYEHGIQLPQYVLRRSNELDREWRRLVERWRRGDVR